MTPHVQRFSVGSVRWGRSGGWLAAAAWLGVAARPLRAQASAGDSSVTWLAGIAGSEEENYLRAAHVALGRVEEPWSLRPLSAEQLRRLAAIGVRHPWASRVMPAAQRTGPFRSAWTASLGLVYNSSYAYSIDDGAVWAGRGATVVASAAFTASYGPLHVQLAPTAFRAANRPFALAPNGRPGAEAFGDPVAPLAIDAPQRFGDRPYARLDPGQSWIRLEGFGATVGVSTANEVWGPAISDPLVLGLNAPGIPHLFVGTSRPANVGIGRLHLRLESGRLAQSPYATVPGDSATRLMSGGIGVLTLNFLPGFEIGGSRFFHRAWPDGGIRPGDLLRPFGELFKDRLPGEGTAIPGAAPDNQLASLFVRWAPPGAGVEAYGEFARNDHAANVRDLLVEPDHNSAYTLGVRRAWTTAGGRLASVRAEVVNARVTHLDRVRPQDRFYQHTELRQGHTNRGQLLGAPAALGGGGQTIAADVYSPTGRWTVQLDRLVRNRPAAEATPADSVDVLHALRVERLRFARFGDWRAGASAVYDLHRNFGASAWSLRLDLGLRYGTSGRRPNG